jgi:lysozyme family protein
VSFEKSIAFVLKWEGGYVNDPSDRGGETRYGISKRVYPDLDIKNLTKEQAVEIYRKDYWERSGADKMTWPICLVHFDTAVNCGVGKATVLRAKANDWKDYLILRIEHYNRLNQPKFLTGWINRVIDLWRTCI